jgi:hypothetical protein
VFGGEGEGAGARVQRVMDPEAVGWIEDLGHEPDGCVVLGGSRSCVLSPA